MIQNTPQLSTLTLQHAGSDRKQVLLLPLAVPPTPAQALLFFIHLERGNRGGGGGERCSECTNWYLRVSTLGVVPRGGVALGCDRVWRRGCVAGGGGEGLFG